MVADKMVRTKWYGQNGMDKNGMDKMAWTKWYGQNGTDKMAWRKWYTDKTVLDKMAWTKWYWKKWNWTKWYWTKWYGQNCRDKMLRIKSPINPVLIYNMSFSSIPLPLWRHLLSSMCLSFIFDFWLLNIY